MKKWKTKQDFAREILERDMTLCLGTNKRVIDEGQSIVIADEIIWYYVKGNAFVPKVAVHNGIRNKRRGAKFLFYYDQPERVISIYDDLFKWYWFPLSRIRCNMRRLCQP
jgi:hypothetical protein